MDTQSIKKTELLAPIVRGLEKDLPDYKSLSLLALKYFGFDELGYVIADRRQDWQRIFQTLVSMLKDDSAWIRIHTLLGSLSSTPQELDQLHEKSGLGRTTISQTINALERGGYTIPFDTSNGTGGRGKRLFYRRS
jgi:biotin operon repressor